MVVLLVLKIISNRYLIIEELIVEKEVLIIKISHWSPRLYAEMFFLKGKARELNLGLTSLSIPHGQKVVKQVHLK